MKTVVKQKTAQPRPQISGNHASAGHRRPHGHQRSRHLSVKNISKNWRMAAPMNGKQTTRLNHGVHSATLNKLRVAVIGGA